MPDNNNEKYLDLITQEYYNKERFFQITKGLLDLVSPATDLLGDFWNYFNLNTAVGSQLDVIGQYFHLNRLLPNVDRDVDAKVNVFGNTQVKPVNVIPEGNRKFVGWTPYNGRTVTLTQNVVLYGLPEPYMIENATRIDLTEATTSENPPINFTFTVFRDSTFGDRILASIYVRNLNSYPIRYSTNLSPAEGSVTSSYVNIPANAAVFINLDFINASERSSANAMFTTQNLADYGKPFSIVAALPYTVDVSNRLINPVDFIPVNGMLNIFNQNMVDVSKGVYPDYALQQNSDGSYTITRRTLSGDIGRFSMFIPFYINANVEFTVSLNVISKSSPDINLYIQFDYDTELGGFGSRLGEGRAYKIPRNIRQFRLYLLSTTVTGSYITFKDFQILLGNYSTSTIPPYKPYSGRLVQIPEVSGIDSITRDMLTISKTGSVDLTSNIKQISFNGTETTWTSNQLESGVYQYIIPVSDITVPNSSEIGKVISRNFFTISYDQSNAGEIGVAISPLSQLVFTSTQTSITNWKSWIAGLSGGLVNQYLTTNSTVSHVEDIQPIELGIDETTNIYLNGTPADLSFDVFNEVYEGNQLLDINYNGIPKVLPDDLYRLILQSRVYQYHWDGTIKGLYSIFNALFPDVILWLQDNGDMSYTVTVMTTELPEFIPELFTLGYITPKPTGIRVNYIMYERPFFSWDLDELFYKGWDQGIWL